MTDDVRPKVLAQLRPANTNAASIYSPPTNTTPEITKIIICNTSSSARTFRIFLDDDGTTYDTTTALFYDAPIPANGTRILRETLGMRDSTGNLAVRSSAANDLTFTVFGRE